MNPLERPNQAFGHTDMGGPVGEASACLREAASAKAGASHEYGTYLPEHLLEFTFGDVLPIPLRSRMIAVRSLEERFARVRFGQLKKLGAGKRLTSIDILPPKSVDCKMFKDCHCPSSHL